jgi:lysophospholipase L1-like esterase
MFSIIFSVISILCLLIILTTAIYFLERFSYSKPFPLFPSKKKDKSILTIGIIGDSWATFNKLDDILHTALLENGFENRILSSGQSGAKTKLIYQNLFKNNNIKYSSKFIIENGPDYCILLGGTNDAVGQMGPNYYSHHLIKIIQLLLFYKIKPIVVTLPKVGIKASHKTLNVFQRWRNRLSAFFNNKGNLDNIESYRLRLEQLLVKEKLKDKIIEIDFDLVCEGFMKGSELYKNPIHLSKIGNKKLANFIAQELIRELKNKDPLVSSLKRYNK